MTSIDLAFFMFGADLLKRVTRTVIMSLTSVAIIAAPFATRGAGQAVAAVSCTFPQGGPDGALCGSPAQPMRGLFFTTVQAPVTYGAGSFSLGADVTNTARIFTRSDKWASVEVGMDYTWTGKQTQYQPYVIAYFLQGDGYSFTAAGPVTTSADGLTHTFTAVPCLGCTTKWDVYYDFEKFTTVDGQGGPTSNFVATGWKMWYEYAKETWPTISNRIQYLDGQGTWRRLLASEVSTIVKGGLCTKGADPTYCWKFNTSITTKTSPNGDKNVVAWNVAKPLTVPPKALVAAPGANAAATAAPRVVRMSAADAVVLTRRLLARPAVQPSRNGGRAHESAAGPSGPVRPAPSDLLVRPGTVGALRASGTMPHPAETFLDSRPVWTVSSKASMRTLTGDHRLLQGFTLVFDSETHSLLSACLGTACPASTQERS